jgi:hypothetical protein
MYPPLELHGVPLPTTVIPMHGENLTFVTVEYADHTYRFSVRGDEVPYEVSCLVEFPSDASDAPRRAWFTIAPERAVNPQVLQEYLYPQLVELHHAAVPLSA